MCFCVARWCGVYGWVFWALITFNSRHFYKPPAVTDYGGCHHRAISHVRDNNLRAWIQLTVTHYPTHRQIWTQAYVSKGFGKACTAGVGFAARPPVMAMVCVVFCADCQLYIWSRLFAYLCFINCDTDINFSLIRVHLERFYLCM